ncbi:hypothetical protein [Streptomyces sp. NPDC048142]|uniref:hypothetical protein n=1 Tax=Streptomyces sp. NPDC048142 TaxID=3365501 RepID=UPI003719373F
MCEALDATSKAEAAEISSRIELSDEIVLGLLHEGIKSEYCQSEPLRLGGMLYPDATGALISNEAIHQSFERCYALLREHGDAASPPVLIREQARRKLLGLDEELPGSAAVLTVDSKSSIEPGV